MSRDLSADDVKKGMILRAMAREAGKSRAFIKAAAGRYDDPLGTPNGRRAHLERIAFQEENKSHYREERAIHSAMTGITGGGGWTVEGARAAYVEGRIDVVEFEERVGRALGLER